MGVNSLEVVVDPVIVNKLLRESRERKQQRAENSSMVRSCISRIRERKADSRKWGEEGV